MKKLLIALMVVSIMAVSAAFGAIQGTTVSEGDSNSYTETSGGSDASIGGNVTLMNLTATASTDRWQGYFGNVTGTLGLGYGADLFYDFSSASALAVYASTNQSFDFSSIEAGAAADVDTAWGYGAGNDQAVDTYVDGNHDISTTNTVTALLEGTGDWYSGIFDQSSNTNKEDFAFGCNITNGVAFDGSDWDYQLLVPAASAGGDTYYFFVEI